MDEKYIKELKKDHGCAPTTIMGIANEYDLDEEKFGLIATGFGGGIGGTFDKGTCGALSGAVLALGLMEDDPKVISEKSKELYEAFKNENGALSCGELTNNGEDKSACPGRCVFMAEKFEELFD